MRDVNQGIDLISSIIIRNAPHRHYQRVTKLADDYLKLFTGEGIGDLIVQFNRREDQEMLDQRKRLYQTVMPAVTNNLETVFMKPLRSTRVFSSIEHSSNDLTTVLNEIKKKFWQGEHDADSGLDAYLQQVWVRMNIYDPNAFIAVGFAPFDNLKEKPQSYPIEYTSSDVWDFKYINGVLDWMDIKKTVEILPAPGSRSRPSAAPRISPNDPAPLARQGEKHVLYLEDDVIEATEVDYNKPDLSAFTGKVDFLEIDKTRKFVIQIYSTKANGVPAIRAGYKLDRYTKDETCVSIFHPAVAFFKKEIKAGSELDITMASHAFPQKIQYAKKCEGDKERGLICNNGRNPSTGQACGVCHGTGVSQVHTTGQDVMFVPYPKGNDPVIDLEKFMVYKAPPIELLKFQDEYVDKLTDKARKAVFAGESLIRANIQKSATEHEIGLDDTYDALHPFCNKYSSVWLFCMKVSAQYADANNDGLKLYHRFPKDLKFKTQGVLMSEYDAGKKSGMPGYLLEAISNDLAEMMYADDQDTLFKLRIKKKFQPFVSKSAEEIATLLTLGMVPMYDQVLYANFDMIFTQIDEELGMVFYLKKYAQQAAEVKKRVEAIITDIDKEKAKRIPLRMEIEGEGNDDDPGNNNAGNPNEDTVEDDDTANPNLPAK
jgi:hypothetical protein